MYKNCYVTRGEEYNHYNIHLWDDNGSVRIGTSASNGGSGTKVLVKGAMGANQIVGTATNIVEFVTTGTPAGGSLNVNGEWDNTNHKFTVGASGAVTGVLFSALLLYPSIELMLFFIPIPIPGYLFGIGYLIYTIYGMKIQNDQIGHTAHFGGALGGIIITIIFIPEVIYTSQLMLGILSLTTLAAGGILFKKQRY